MSIVTAFLFVTAIATTANAHCNGCVNLDQYNFHKLIDKFKVSLVKFDASYPYGSQHDVFTKLAEELATHESILIGEVGIKDYGEKDNQKLGEKYGVKSKDDHPQIQLFVQGRSNPVVFHKNKEWSIENLRNLIRDNTDIYIGMPGCIEKFDKLADAFVKDETSRQNKLKEAQELVKAASEKDKSAAKTYVLYMQKIIENGEKFIAQEVKRLGKILKDDKINKKKQDEMSLKLNVLHSFKTGITKSKVEL